MNSVQADFNWLSEHSQELAEKYPNKWIAVHAGKVVGVGETAVQADDQAREQCPDGDYILEAVDAATDVIYGSL